ncbi:chromosome segregation in meiosis- protein [Podila epicladia]|nr:chromosome segregation in meiosis- protein [Podila epicladia]
MNDINLDDEVFEQFDTYEDDYNEQMMLEAERQGQLRQQSSSSSNGHHATTTSAVDALPPQRDFIAMLNEAHERNERAFGQEQQQRQEEARRLAGAGAPGVDIGAVQVAKKRVKIVTLDNEKLMSEQGLPLLLKQGKRLKIRHKYTSQAEKNANVTWAHNLFPKANFRDFIVRAESKCRTDRQLRATMDGWRDAHWGQDKVNRAAKEDAAREEQDTRERHEAIWKEAGITEDLERDPLSLDDHGEGSSKSTGAGSLSASSSTYPVFNNNNNNNNTSSISTHGGFSKSTVQGKAKVPQEYNASAAMRLAISDDDDESNDYEIALDRMRKSMNLGQDSDRRKSLSTRKEEAPRKNEIDLDDYDSDVDEDEDEPLFTHRALQMMGGLNAAQSQDTPSISNPTAAEGSVADPDDSHTGVEAMDEDKDMEHITEKPAPAPTTTSSASPPLGDNEHDDEDTFARRKPARHWKYT